MSVRLPSAQHYAAQVTKEQHWLPRLAPQCPLPITTPLAQGRPAVGFPWAWSVYNWLPGQPAARQNIKDLNRFASNLAQFLLALWKIDSVAGPPPGANNFHRGGALSVYGQETRDAIAALAPTIDATLAAEIWQTACASQWQDLPVWVHGDIAPGNLLVSHGALTAVIDFYCSAVGDPACDLAIYWTFLDHASRDIFRATLALDQATWDRARGWALWKALITVQQHQDSDPAAAEAARDVIERITAEYRTRD